MRPMKYDHNIDLITLTVITISDFEKLYFYFFVYRSRVEGRRSGALPLEGGGGSAPGRHWRCQTTF